jgi:hypothetical protein
MRITVICTIPVSFILETALGDPWNWVRFGGAIVIICGFALFSYATDQEIKGSPVGGIMCNNKEEVAE